MTRKDGSKTRAIEDSTLMMTRVSRTQFCQAVNFYSKIKKIKKKKMGSRGERLMVRNLVQSAF